MSDKNDGVMVLPDGSACAVVSMPLPKDHWIYVETEGHEPPPMPIRMGTDAPARKEWEAIIRAAGKYAIRASTMRGKAMDFDPDAMLQNLVVGMLGYFTPDGLDSESWQNPANTESPTIAIVRPGDAGLIIGADGSRCALVPKGDTLTPSGWMVLTCVLMIEDDELWEKAQEHAKRLVESGALRGKING